MLSLYNADYKAPEERITEDLQCCFDDIETVDPEQWPYGVIELSVLLQRWVRKISVDLAAHVPPKMACMIGNFWNIFGQEGYKEITFKLLNNLIFAAWFKNMINLVNVNAGFIYQLSKQEQYDALIQEVRRLLPDEAAREDVPK
jgi:hypothetical protein